MDRNLECLPSDSTKISFMSSDESGNIGFRLITLARLNIAYSVAQEVVILRRCYPLWHKT